MECGDSSPLWEFRMRAPSKNPKAATSRRTPYPKLPGGAVFFFVAVELIVKRLQADPQFVGGARLVPVVLLEHAEDVGHLDVGERPAGGLRCGRRRGRGCRQ